MNGGRTGSDSNESADGDDRDLTHLDKGGNVWVVSVDTKPDSRHQAATRRTVHLNAATVRAIRDDEIGKGDMLATVRIGTIQAVRHMWETIPMCHQIPVTNIGTELEVADGSVTLSVMVGTTSKAGCEMGTLEGVTIDFSVVWDMVGATGKNDGGQYPGTRISGVEVVTKEKETFG